MSTTNSQDEGVGCGLVAAAFGSFFVFAGATFLAGLLTTNFSLVFAALPASALLTALGGEFVLAWPIDVVSWMVLAFGATKLIERRRLSFATVVAAVLAAALVYGLVLGLAVEPSGEFLGR